MALVSVGKLLRQSSQHGVSALTGPEARLTRPSLRAVGRGRL